MNSPLLSRFQNLRENFKNVVESWLLTYFDYKLVSITVQCSILEKINLGLRCEPPFPPRCRGAPSLARPAAPGTSSEIRAERIGAVHTVTREGGVKVGSSSYLLSYPFFLFLLLPGFLFHIFLEIEIFFLSFPTSLPRQISGDLNTFELNIKPFLDFFQDFDDFDFMHFR